MGVDQGFFAPIFLAGFMGFMGRVNGHSQEKVISDIKRDYVDVMIRNYQVFKIKPCTLNCIKRLLIIKINYPSLAVACCANYQLLVDSTSAQSFVCPNCRTGVEHLSFVQDKSTWRSEGRSQAIKSHFATWRSGVGLKYDMLSASLIWQYNVKNHDFV